MCYLLIGPLPEDGQSENSSDGWSEVARHRLDVNVQLPAVGWLEDGDPDHAHHHQNHGHNPGAKANCVSASLFFMNQPPAHSHMSATPANQQQLSLRGSWPVLLPDVHGKERGAAVEDGRQRRHQSGHHHSYHKSPKACKNAYADTQMQVKTPEKCCVAAWKKKTYSHRLAWVQWPVWGKQCWSIQPQLHTLAHTPLDPHSLQSLKHGGIVKSCVHEWKVKVTFPLIQNSSLFPSIPTKGTKEQIQGRSMWKHSNVSVPTTYNPHSQSHWSSQLVSTALPL